MKNRQKSKERPNGNAATEPGPQLKPGIKKWDLVLMVINSIIGAGTFALQSKIFQVTGV